MLKFLLNEEHALNGDLNLCHVLSTAPAEFLEVISAAREVFEPHAQLNGTCGGLLLSKGLLTRLIICEPGKLDRKLFLLIVFNAAQGHRDASKDLIRSPGQDLAHFDRIDVRDMLTLLFSQVALRPGLVEQVFLPDDLIPLGGLSRFTFRRLVELLVELLLDAQLVLPILEGIEVAIDELVEHG